MALYRIHYRSQASGQLTNSDVEELINKAKTNNHGKNITGAILLVDDYFMQVIEGEKEEVKKLF